MIRKDQGLGERFLAEINAAIAMIEENPLRQPLYYREFRRILTRRFPYKIFYVINEEQIIVFRVLHTKQDYPAWL